MKKYLLIVLVLGAIVACKKHGVSPSVNVIGKWELTRRYGGNILPQDTTYKAGNGNILQFNADSTFKQYTNGALTSSGTFHINKNMVYFNTNSYIDQAFSETISVAGNILTIYPWLGDIATTQYDKIQN